MSLPLEHLAPRASRAPRRAGVPALALTIGLVLAFATNEACAAALGSLATSVGLFGALAALFVIKAWPAHMPASALSTVAVALAIAVGATWLWRTRVGVAARVASLGLVGGTAAGLVTQPLDRSTQPLRCRLPESLDRDTLLRQLRLHFVQLQRAWDLGEMQTLESLATAEMLAELCSSLPGCAGDGERGGTDVVTLHAELFGFEELGETFLVSVEFSGLMRESSGDSATPFRELWMLTRSKNGISGWKLARHQALI